MIANLWDSAFTAQYGHEFPNTYLCFDTEFTGSSEASDLVLEIGHTMVENGEVVDQVNYVLNWYAYPDIKEAWLTYKLNAMRSIVGPKWRLSPEVIKAEGKDPVTILRFYHKLFSTWQKRNLCFVAQNGQNADERMLRGNFFRYLNKPFGLPDNAYFDTGGIFKATQVYTSPQTQNYKLEVLPLRSDTLKGYFRRVINTRFSGIKWSLPVILQHYDLIKKHNLDMNQHHTAGFDSRCLHYIMEAFRAELSNQPKQAKKTDFLSPAHLEELLNEEIQKNIEEKQINKPIIDRKRGTKRQRVI